MIKLPNKHKRGDTFSFDITWVGVQVDQLKCQVRTAAGIMKSELEISDLGNDSYRLTARDTTQWPIEVLETDVQWTDADGNIKSSDTILITVAKDVTQ